MFNLANLTILVFSFIILLITLMVAREKWLQLDLVDIYIIFVGICFGGHSFVKALVNDYSKIDLMAAFWVFVDPNQKIR